MAKKVAVGHWECEYCGMASEEKLEVLEHEKKDCEYRYDRYE